MNAEEIYEVRVRVKTLTDASKLFQLLDTAGFKEVDMGPLREPFPAPLFSRMKEDFRGNINKKILKALYRLGAMDMEHAVETEKVVEEMKKDLASENLPARFSEGILSRTVTMITHAILVERHGWVSYDKKQYPRRFWLTDKGVEKIKNDKNLC